MITIKPDSYKVKPSDDAATIKRRETAERMRRWRASNVEKNRDNDTRCRVNRVAKDKFGNEDTPAKLAWIHHEYTRRTDNRHRRSKLHRDPIDLPNSYRGGTGGMLTNPSPYSSFQTSPAHPTTGLKGLSIILPSPSPYLISPPSHTPHHRPSPPSYPISQSPRSSSYQLPPLQYLNPTIAPSLPTLNPPTYPHSSYPQLRDPISSQAIQILNRHH